MENWEIGLTVIMAMWGIISTILALYYKQRGDRMATIDKVPAFTGIFQYDSFRFQKVEKEPSNVHWQIIIIDKMDGFNSQILRKKEGIPVDNMYHFSPFELSKYPRDFPDIKKVIVRIYFSLDAGNKIRYCKSMIFSKEASNPNLIFRDAMVEELGLFDRIKKQTRLLEKQWGFK